jgi:hypothetical protein
MLADELAAQLPLSSRRFRHHLDRRSNVSPE